MGEFDSLKNPRVLLAFAVFIAAFAAWTQTPENSLVILIVAAALLAVALMWRVHPEHEEDFEAHEKKDHDIPGLSEHPESHEEEAHGYPAGH
jgi:flagellar biosynthesis component FlhA